MKAILEFNLPEDQFDFDTAVSAQKYYGILFDLDQKLRGEIKHGHGFKTANEALQVTRQFLNDSMMEADISFR